MPVVSATWSSLEIERHVVATASRAMDTNPEINRRFMETSVWLDTRIGLHHPYCRLLRPNVCCITYHVLVLLMRAGSIGSLGRMYAPTMRRSSHAATACVA